MSMQEMEASIAESRHVRKVLGYTLLFFGIIIALLVGLTFTDRIGGEALLFFVGTVVGYIVSLVRSLLRPVVVVWEV